MIRKFKEEDTVKVMTIWTKGNFISHDFIEKDYWLENFNKVKNYYIPNSDTYVYTEKDELKGFISVFEKNYIGALFVDGRFQGRGIGRKLLEYVRRRRPNLSLKAYAQNEKAIGFYRHKGFKILSENMDNKTQAKELLLVWNKGCISGYAKRFPGDS